MQPSVLDAWGLREIPWVREWAGMPEGSRNPRTGENPHLWLGVDEDSIEIKTSLTAKTAVGLLGPLLLLLM